MSEKKLDEHRILSYVTGLLYFYGVMEFESLYRAVTDNLPVSLDRQTFKTILDKEMFNEDSYDIDSDNGRYYHFAVEDADLVLEEQAKRAEIPFRPVSEKEAHLVVNGQYRSLWHPAVKKLDRLLQEKYGWSRSDALDEILDGQDMLRNDLSPMEMVKGFLSHMHFRTREEVQPFVDMLMGLANHTPLWVLKGWTPHESLEKHEKPRLKPMPDKSFTPPEGKQEEQLSLFKVGRNEPCPCGSGKKFKKCCNEPLTVEDNEQAPAPVEKESPSPVEPTLEEWGALYEAAAAFKEAKCWEWMDNNDLFGVMDPETGEIVYCCIMGCLGEHYALAVYLGPEGLASVLNMISLPDDISPDLYFAQKALMASFENREALRDEDRAVIKELGLKFRGKNQWPLFRSYEPGLYPWFISAWECRLLTVALQQALEVSLRCRRDKSILECDGPRDYLVRVPRKVENKTTWVDRHLEAPGLVKEYAVFKISDELRLRKVLASAAKGRATWEIDTFRHPSPVQEKKDERPYFPTVFLILDSSGGLILRFELLSDLAREGYRCIETMLELLGNQKVFPSRILVERDETYYLLETACRQLNIPLEKVKRLKLMPGIREELFSKRF